MRFLRSTALWILLLPYAATFVGAASNQLVLIANHDKFPVLANSVKLEAMGYDAANEMIDDTHCVMTHQTHLNAFADIFDFNDGIYSVGDLLIMTGGWLSGFCIYIWVVVAAYKLRQP